MTILQRRRAGMSLVEVLVAVVITVGLAVVLLSVTVNALNLWRRAQDAFTGDVEAKLALDLITRDLQGALFAESGGAWLAADVISAPSILSAHGWQITGTIKPSGAESLNLLPPDEAGIPAVITQARFGLSGAWLRFATTNVETKSAGNPAGSAPVVVSYQIARRPLSGAVSAGNPAAVRYTLFRSAVANDSTLIAGFDVRSSTFSSTIVSFPAARAPRSITNPSSGDAVASNVVDFAVWLYRRDGSGALQRIFPATETDFSHASVLAAEFPDVADVMLRVLTDEGARMVETIESGNGGLVRPSALTESLWWWSVVTAHSQVYSRRIDLKAGGR